jgi:hypothetical protein
MEDNKDARDYQKVANLLGRRPKYDFMTVVSKMGEPVVILNKPYSDSKEPNPTIFWLVGKEEKYLVSVLESNGGIKDAQKDLNESDIKKSHRNYSEFRSQFFDEYLLEFSADCGVGGTKKGVKCLHAHLAAYLAGLEDPVGQWTCKKINLDISLYERKDLF